MKQLFTYASQGGGDFQLFLLISRQIPNFPLYLRLVNLCIAYQPRVMALFPPSPNLIQQLRVLGILQEWAIINTRQVLVTGKNNEFQVFTGLKTQVLIHE